MVPKRIGGKKGDKDRQKQILKTAKHNGLCANCQAPI